MTVKIVVVVPDDAEYKRRVALREAEEGKEVPDSAVHNMKANFVLPEIEETYATEVVYTELPPNEASNLVTRYNLEAEAMGVSQQPGVRNFVKKCTMARMKLGATNVIVSILKHLGISYYNFLVVFTPPPFHCHNCEFGLLLFLPAVKHAGLWIIIGHCCLFVAIISRKPLQAREAWEYR